MRPANASAVRRLPLLALLLAGAVVCAFSTGDRLSNLPGHASSRLSPTWFGSGNARQNAVRALDRRDFASALNWAKIVVSRDPLGQDSTSLLGVSLLGVGRPAEAQQAYTAAASTGWRDQGVQTYWLMSALALGDLQVAAERLDALLRTDNRDSPTLAGLTQLESSSEGRAALATRLASQPDWGNWYVQSLASLRGDSLNRRFDVILLAQRLGFKPLTAVAANVANLLGANGQVEQAAQVWRKLGSGGNGTGLRLTDGGFEHPEITSPANPFVWIFATTGLVDVRIDADPPTSTGKALYIDSSATTTQAQLAVQTLLLPPASYILRWTAADARNRRSAAADVSILCKESGQVLTATANAIGSTGYVSAFSVPSTGCRSQLVSIDALPQPVTSRGPVWVDNVTITQAQSRQDLPPARN